MNDVAEIELDLSGLRCPMPLLKTKQALNRLGCGQKIRVTSTDPGSERDFKVFVEQSGNRLLEFTKEGGSFHFLLEKQ